MSRHLVPYLRWWWLLVVASVLAIWPTCRDRQARQRGEELFQQNCAICHEASNLDLKKQPPKLEGLFQSKTCPAAHRPQMNRFAKPSSTGLAPCQPLTND